METLKLSVDTDGINKSAEILKNGGLVGIPTETVYGLAANALDSVAVSNIFKAKGRPQDNPLIVHISRMEMINGLVTEIPEKAVECAKRFWPGPLTMIMKKSDSIPYNVSAGLDTVAIRMPKSQTARDIISACGLPLAAPSANLSGAPSPTTAERVVEDMDGKIDAVVMGENCEVGVESTVVTFVTNPPRLLRPGGITVEDLREIIPDIVIDKAVLSEPEKGARVSSPGMKYKHYAPKANVVLVEGDSKRFAEFLNKKRKEDNSAFALIFSEDAPLVEKPYIIYGSSGNGLSQAENIFEDLRRLDELGVKNCYVHAPDKTGVGLAVYNRLIRAAAFEVIKL